MSMIATPPLRQKPARSNAPSGSKEMFACQFCGLEFWTWRSQGHSYCSKRCFYAAAPKSLVGRRFGRLVAIERTRDQKSQTTFYRCQCDCGAEVPAVQHSNLLSDSAQSCGCLKRETVARRSRREPGHAVKTNIWLCYIRNAKQRGHSWELTRIEVETLILSACHYCGCVGSMQTKSSTGDVLSRNGIDRLDNTRGYTRENSVACCKPCNQAKNDRTLEEFRIWAQTLCARLGSW